MVIQLTLTFGHFTISPFHHFRQWVSQWVSQRVSQSMNESASQHLGHPGESTCAAAATATATAAARSAAVQKW